MMPKIHFLCAVLALTAAPALAETPDYSAGGGKVYASVRGWTVVQSDRYGCSAYPEAMPIVFNTPPAGGWQLIFPYHMPGVDGEYQGLVEIDKYSFEDTFYGEDGFFYGSFPLAMRQTFGQGSEMAAEVGGQGYTLTLSGSTAALLKLEECWQVMTGWTEDGSSRAGTFAFSGD